MRILCPYCGVRDAEEFAIQGEVAGPRPEPGDFGPAALDAFHDYVHLRANEYGPTREYWYHAAGCRRWLIVSRDTRGHAILKTEFAAL
jgi:heterotetrameric sarcosine oxidase delta subunit